MASVTELHLFSWKNLNDLGDLERAELVINYMPDQKILRALNAKRGKRGRNRYPCRPVWNSILAGIVFQHPSIESLRRELMRNGQLRELCGFNPALGKYAVPSASAYSRFLKQLCKLQSLIDEMFDQLIERLKELLPKFGQDLAGDSKAISSYANQLKGDPDADWGKKTYRGVKKDGTLWEKVKSWFGYKLHLIVDANYELPVAYSITRASRHDAPVMRELFGELEQAQPDLVENCDHFMGDRGYDDHELITQLFHRNIKPVINIRNQWRDRDQTRIFPHRHIDNLTYDYKGTIFCHCPKTGEVRPMVYAGYEKNRHTLKYRCPAKEFGFTCAGASQCPLFQGVRISIHEDLRRFTPLPRSTHKWKRLYNKRTSVERVNSRIATSFGLEKHFIRRKAPIQLRCSLALCTILAIAVGRIEQGRPELMRSLTKAA